MNCPICKKKDVVQKNCDYKYEIQEDIKYFDKLEILKCNDCDFNFAHPMPKEENLNYFYQNIYRKIDRPPYWVTDNDEDAENRYLEDKNLNYLLYISTLLDLKKIKNIYDFGAGFGDLGYAIKKKFPNVNLYCTEYDLQCRNILKKRGYTNLPLSEIDEKFDLIITLHSLEHLTDVEVFNDFNLILNPRGIIFFEVPNCPKEYFEGRPYDGPHLLFYTKKSIESICQKFKFDVDRIDISSYSFEKDHIYQKQSQDRYYRLNKGINFDRIKNMIKKIMPFFVIKIVRFFSGRQIDEMHKLSLFTSNSGDNCYLRGVLRKKDDI